jgi:hypothetical protein
MITCKQATELLSKQMEKTLSLKERFNLYLHLRICVLCVQFGKQLQIIRRVLKRDDTDDSRLSSDAKQRIQKYIKHKLND